MRMASLLHGPRIWRALARLVAGFVAMTAVTAGILWVTMPVRPVPIHVRWKTDVTDNERRALERQFRFASGEFTEGTTWTYWLTDPSTADIRAIVQHPRVDDTHHINRIRFRPRFANDRSRQIVAFSVLSGAMGSLLLVVAPAARSTFKVRNGVERRL